MSKRIISVAILALLLVTPECLSKTVTLYVDWDEARAIWEHGDFRESVKVTLTSSKPRKGHLAAITDSSVRVRKHQSEIVIARDDVRSIRLVPRRTSRWIYRLLAIGAGIPAGLLAAYGGLAICGDIDRASACNNSVPYIAWGATQYLLYRLGAKADRGAVVLVLPAANSAQSNIDPDSPPGPPREQP